MVVHSCSLRYWWGRDRILGSLVTHPSQIRKSKTVRDFVSKIQANDTLGRKLKVVFCVHIYVMGGGINLIQNRIIWEEKIAIKKISPCLGAGPSQQPRQKQARASDLCGNRPKTGTPQKQAWVNNLHQSRPKRVTSLGVGMSEQPP